MLVDGPSASLRAAFSSTTAPIERARKQLFYRGRHFRRALAHSAGFRGLSAARLAALSVPFAAVTLSGVPTAGAMATVGLTQVPADGLHAPTGSAAVPGPAPTSRSWVTTVALTEGPRLGQLVAGADGARPGPAAAVLSSLVGGRAPLPTSGRTAPGVAAFGDAPVVDRAGSHQFVGVATAPGRGYWAVNNQGEVYAFGDAARLGSLPARHNLGPVVGITASPRGDGYWVLTARGAVFPFGDAIFYGSPDEAHLGSPVVGMAASPSGRGYWLVTAKGRVFAFGEARVHHAHSRSRPAGDVIGIAAAPGGQGYWLATAGGHVFSYGAARAFGGAAASGQHFTAITASAPAAGYWLVSEAGHVHAYGAALDLGSADLAPGIRATALAATPYGIGYVMATGYVPAPSLKVDVSPLAAAENGVREVARREQSVVDHRTATAARAAAHPVMTFTRRAKAGTTTTTAAMSYLGNFTVTCYDNYGVTASGAEAGMQSVAVDPAVIPLGTQIYVDGVGQRIADDTGGDVIGDHVDIWEPSYAQCVDWGVRTRAVFRVNG